MPPYLMHQDDATRPAKPANENDANLYRSTRAFIRAHLFRPALKSAATGSRVSSRNVARNPYELLAGSNTPSRSNAPERSAAPAWQATPGHNTAPAHGRAHAHGSAQALGSANAQSNAQAHSAQGLGSASSRHDAPNRLEVVAGTNTSNRSNAPIRNDEPERSKR